MKGSKAHDGPAQRLRLLAALSAAAAIAPHAGAQIGIPIFETRHELRYRFPEESIEVAPATFRTTLRGTETIIRDQRQTAMHYDGMVGFTLAARPLTSSERIPEGTVDLYARLTDLRLECRAGRGSWSLVVNEDGLVQNRPMLGEQRFEPHEKYVGSHTVSSLMAKPATMRFANGALLEPPPPHAMLIALECSWVYSGIASILPPLPARGIDTGRTWKAGMPVRLSVFGQPQIIRLDFRFEEFDEETHIAVVSWNTTLASTSVVPAPGVHHIGADALASGTISGSMRLQADTGAVLSSEMRTDVKISHLRSSATTVQFTMTYTLENLGTTEGGSLTASSGAFGTGSDR